MNPSKSAYATLSVADCREQPDRCKGKANRENEPLSSKVSVLNHTGVCVQSRAVQRADENDHEHAFLPAWRRKIMLEQDKIRNKRCEAGYIGNKHSTRSYRTAGQSEIAPSNQRNIPTAPMLAKVLPARAL